MPNKKLTYDQVKTNIESQGYKLVSTEYDRNSTKMEMICPVGHTCFISYMNFNRKNVGTRCNHYDCFLERLRNNRNKKSPEELAKN